VYLLSSLSFSLTLTSAPVLHTHSLHDALPIYPLRRRQAHDHPHHGGTRDRRHRCRLLHGVPDGRSEPPDLRLRIGSAVGYTVKRSEEHTSELQSRFDLVCRHLLDKNKYSHHQR